MGSSPSKGDKQDDSHSTKQSNNDHHHHMMPLFRKQSGSAKKKLQHKQYLAREEPELTYNISDCEISDIPAGTFSLIKVLQKEALLANNNWLTALKGGGSFKDLLALRIFDLHDNELVSLPNEIDEMKHLQVLNLENNKIKNLPTSIGSLISLQTLNLKGNKLKELPDSICKLRCLRTLNVHKNHMTRLPPGLCEVRTLETLVLDAESMTYPPADICSQGTEAIMRFLCSERGLQYEPPSKFLLDVLDVPTAEPLSMKRHSLQADVIALHGALQQYESMKEEKRRERALLEKQLEDDQRLQAQLAAKAAADKKHLIEFVAKDQDRFDGELAAIQNQKEQERGLLVNALREAERTSGDLVNQLLEMNEKARRTEELVEQMERERMETEEWFIVRQEEAESLRKREVIAAMEQVLAESQAFNLMIENYLNTRGEAAKNYQEKSDEMNHLLESLLDDKLIDQRKLIEKLMTEEKLQKEAFETLMLQKDAKTQRITSQIELIEQELAQLTLLEVERRDMRLDTQMNILAERRVDLTALLVQLMQERDSRAEQLRERLDEMEQQKEDSQIDYWLIQYQRLMDRKPQSLINQEKQLEYSVIEILERANASDYIPTFARHRITIETMCQMDEEDLKQMTIHELGVRKSIMTQIERYKQNEEERAAAKLKGFEPHEKPSIPKIPSAPPIPEPSAPPAEDQEFDEKLSPEKKGASGGASGSATSTPSAPELPHPGEVTARGINTECVICMEETSSMLFLNCGHVCTCDKCSPSVDACPLCRANIVQRIRLMITKASFSRQTSTASQK